MKHRSISYYKKREKYLSNKISDGEKYLDINNFLLELGWLYDQWSLLESKTIKKILQIKAKKYFRKVLKKEPQNLSALNGLGTVYLHENKYLNSLKYYKKLHSIHQSSMSHNALGNVYRQLGKSEFAIDNYKKAMQLADNPVDKKAAIYNLNQVKVI